MWLYNSFYLIKEFEFYFNLVYVYKIKKGIIKKYGLLDEL